MPIRFMTEGDLAAVTGLYRDANRFARKAEILTWTQKGLARFPELNWVYFTGGRVVGALSAVRGRAGRITLNDVAVEERRRGKKIGTALLKRLIGSLKNSPAKSIGLWVHWSNARAIPFYFQRGFRLKGVKRIQNVFGVPDGEEVIVMEKKL